MTGLRREVPAGGPILAIVDGIFDDPDAVRGAMLALPFQRPDPVNYPGVSAPLPAALRPELDPDWLGHAHGMRLLAPFAAEARLTLADDAAERRSLVHADVAEVTAVVHLSAPQDDGLYFYRHRRLGVTRISPADPWLAFVQGAVTGDSCNLSEWDVIGTVPMTFNRLIVFAGRSFHSGPHRLTGDDAKTGRLTQNLFYGR